VSKVLLTGGAGFIGERLASTLATDGNEVHLVDNLSRGSRDEALETLATRRNVRLFELDLVAPDALDSLSDDYDLVVHLAAIVGVQNVSQHPYQTLRDNLMMHNAAIRFARRQKALRRFLYTSTSEVYVGSLLHLGIPVPTPEDVPLALPALNEPRSSYMLSKIYGEAMIHHSGLPFTIVRPHNVYGPRMGMSHIVPQLLQKADRALPHSAIEVFSVEHSRCFCFIDDAVAMLRLALFSAATLNQVLNLGAEAPEVTVRHVAEIVIATVGKPLRIEAKPPTPGSPERRAPKMTRMTQATGYVAQVSLEEGIRRTYDWYRVHIFDTEMIERKGYRC
jgi:nucleoside-diphosphate-sugar epimerase